MSPILNLGFLLLFDLLSSIPVFDLRSTGVVLVVL